MSPYVERFVERLRDAEDDLKREVDEQQQRWQYRVHRGRVWCDKELRENHRRLRQNIPVYIVEGNLFSLLTAPIIYSLLCPFVVLDFWVTLYQWVCFPIYGIARVRRRRYFTIDRHKLAYLNGIEKANCTCNRRQRIDDRPATDGPERRYALMEVLAARWLIRKAA